MFLSKIVSVTLTASARNGYPGLEPVPRYPVNTRVPGSRSIPVSLITAYRGGRLGCFQYCCLRENNYFDQSNFTFDCHDYIAVTYNRNCKRLSSSRLRITDRSFMGMPYHVSGSNFLYSSLCQPHSSPSVSFACSCSYHILANVNSRSRSLYAVARPSVVCLSVCLSVCRLSVVCL